MICYSNCQVFLIHLTTCFCIRSLHDIRIWTSVCRIWIYLEIFRYYAPWLRTLRDIPYAPILVSDKRAHTLRGIPYAPILVSLCAPTLFVGHVGIHTGCVSATETGRCGANQDRCMNRRLGLTSPPSHPGWAVSGWQCSLLTEPPSRPVHSA